MRRRSHQSGFTLVELVTVIVVLGILSIGTVSFINDSTEGFAAAGRRTELGTDARLAFDRMSRELRNALPNSARVSGSCIEHVPVLGASSYLSLPVGVTSTTFLIAPVLNVDSLTGARVAVYPDDTTALYTLAVTSPISPTVTLSAPDAQNRVTVTMAAAHGFPNPSPEARLYLVGTPISYCVVGARLYRYAAYGFSVAQPTAASLPTALPGRTLIGDTVAVATTPFSIASATLTRNAVVKMEIEFGGAEERVRLNHLVQLRNVP